MMRQMSAATLLVLALGMFCATATHANDDERLAITHLVMRDRIITIHSTPSGVLYSISTKDGAVLDASLNEAQLQAKYPDVYENVRPAVAGSEALESVTPWAGM